MKRDLQSLLDMLQSAQIARNYMAGQLQNELETDLQLQDAVIRRLLREIAKTEVEQAIEQTEEVAIEWMN